MKIISQTDWKFSPTRNRDGMARGSHDINTVIVVQSDLFKEPTIAMSDIHSHTSEVIDRLSMYVDLSKCVVITAGDMAGAMVYGSDADPTEDLLHLNDMSKEFYYVHGNHDAPTKETNEKLRQLLNREGKYCSLDAVSLPMLGGVDGIISEKAHINKFPKHTYLQKLERVLKSKVHVLLTHETPCIPKYYSNGDRYIGNMELFELVNKYKPKVHMYGHCHHPEPFSLINGVQYVNLDARIIIFVPTEALWESIRY